MYYLPDCSSEELDLLLSTSTDRNGVFSESVKATLKEILEGAFWLGIDKYKKYSCRDCDGETDFITIKNYKDFPENSYKRYPAPVYKYWSYKENKDIRWFAIPNPLYYYTFIYNILEVKPLLIHLYEFFDSSVSVI